MIAGYTSAVARAVGSQEVSARRKKRVVIDGHARRDRAHAVRAFDLPAAYFDQAVAAVINLDEFIVGPVGSARAEFTDDYRRNVVVGNCYGARTFLNSCAIDICHVNEECFVCFDVCIADNCQFEWIDLFPRGNCLLHEAMGQIVMFTNCCRAILRGNIKGYRLRGGI